MGRRDAQRGFTFLEIAVGLLILGGAFAVFSRVFTTSNDLTQEGRAALRAHEDLRRNLEAVANVIRVADIDTLSGFDGNGRSVSPSFRRVTGADLLGRTHGPDERILWEALPGSADRIENPGRVVHEVGGVRTLLADRVPMDGFSVLLDGNTLIVHLATYSSTSGGRTATVSGETAISFRN